MKKGNLVYGQSGGPSPVINASAYGVLSSALSSPQIDKVYALQNGIDGLLNENFYDASILEHLDLLIQTPASAFGSVRFQLDSYKEDPSIYERIYQIFKKHNIRYFIYNGGNDSMDTCLKLSQYFDTIDYDISIVGVPKTIDNDLAITDHTPGYASSAKYIINTLVNIKHDSEVYPKGKVTIVEIMGRHAGWLTAASYVACNEGVGPDLIYLPEHEFDLQSFIKEVDRIYSENKQCLIALSEGIKDKDRNFIAAMNASVDAFGHQQLGGVGLYLSRVVEEELQLQTRVIELSTPQRACTFLRSKVDVDEAIKVGEEAVRFALEKESNIMVGIKRVSNNPYRCEYITVPIAQVANKEKAIPSTMLCKNGVTQEFFDYIYPLLEGETKTVFKAGVLQTFKV